MRLEMRDFLYDRQQAVAYAHRWAYSRNPDFYDFSHLGGDCTNFASQCIYAGSGVMNFNPTYGWYYISLNQRAPAWTGVLYLYNFLTQNQSVGPYGREVTIDQVEPGDICQLEIDEGRFQHSPVIVAVGSPATPENVLVAAHSADRDYYPIAAYPYVQSRFIHIEGVRTMVRVE